MTLAVLPGSTASPAAPTRVLAQASATPGIVAAANAFLTTLDDSQRAAGVFDFSDTTDKIAWSNLPRGLFQWSGVRMGDLSADQQQLVQALLQATLSQSGYDRVMASVNADEYLKSQSGSNPLQFGADNYSVAIFGTPSMTEPWMFRFGGHHMTVNATIVGDNITLAPSFPGCQPCDYTPADQELRPDAEQVDKGFALINALDADQQQQAILGSQGIDLVLGPNQPMKTVAAEGIPASALTADQQGMLVDLIGVYVNMLTDQNAATRMNDIESNFADTYFAWYGPTTPGNPAYYRIQGPTLWIEFAPQGGGGAGNGLGIGGTLTTDHVHAIYGDPTNEYGSQWSGQQSDAAE
jgi:Protein of unknown function (DUF3500)